MKLNITIDLDDDAMTNSDEVTEAVNEALGRAGDFTIGDTGAIIDMAGRAVGRWIVKL